MILTGARFVKICKLIWGRDWASGAARLFDQTSKTMQRWAKDGPPARARLILAQRLEDRIAEEGAELEQLREDALEW